MTAQGTRKAAMLLMNLPPGAAAELLRSAKPETMTRILAEVAYLQNQGPAAGSTEPVREFSTLVSKGRPREAKGELAKQIAEGAMGAKAPEVMREVQDLLLRRDPFGSVRSVPVGALAKTLAGEAPQVVTMVLAELSVAGSTQLPEPAAGGNARGGGAVHGRGADGPDRGEAQSGGDDRRTA